MGACFEALRNFRVFLLKKFSVRPVFGRRWEKTDSRTAFVFGWRGGKVAKHPILGAEIFWDSRHGKSTNFQETCSKTSMRALHTENGRTWNEHPEKRSFLDSFRTSFSGSTWNFRRKRLVKPPLLVWCLKIQLGSRERQESSCWNPGSLWPHKKR